MIVNNILLCYGTRPEWIKIKPLIKELNAKNFNFKVLFTGQQTDIGLGGNPDYIHSILESGSNRLDNIIKSCLSIPDNYFQGINSILVQGDTASAFGLALGAFHRSLKIIHLEAGLRTHNKSNPYPEEVYRQMISRLADIHLCPTQNNMDNLIKESIINNTYVTGNTAIDNLVSLGIRPTKNNIVLITLHRRENHNIIDKWFIEINKLAESNKNLQFILPIHPNPNIQKHKDILTNVKVINPVSHEELISLIASSKLIITDSGGVQEEGSYYNKKIIVCRKLTERTESLSLTNILCKNPKNLSILFNELIMKKVKKVECPYGKGDATQQIVKILSNV